MRSTSMRYVRIVGTADDLVQRSVKAEWPAAVVS